MAPESASRAPSEVKPAPTLEGCAKIRTSSYLKAFSAVTVLWEVGNMPRTPERESEQLDFNSDRFPSVRKALHQIADEADTYDGQPEHLEIHFLASGEATWKMWIKGRDETVGNVLQVG